MKNDKNNNFGGPWAPKIIFGALGPPLGPWGASRPMGPGARASRPMGLKDPGPQGRWGPWGGPWAGPMGGPFNMIYNHFLILKEHILAPGGPRAPGP